MPAKANDLRYAMLDEPAMAAKLKPNGLRQTRMDFAPKLCTVLSSLQRFWGAVFYSVETDCGAEPCGRPSSVWWIGY